VTGRTPRSRRGPRFAAALLALGLLPACAGAPLQGRTLSFDSRSYGFVDELGTPGQPLRGRGTLLWPGPGAGTPVPAVVLLHSSIGQGSQDWAMARRLTGAGFAVLAVDSFGPRGVEKTVEDQTAVSAASMLADAYAAGARLTAEPGIDADRIAVLGFSKGGIAAFYAAVAAVHARAAPPGQAPFAAHVAYYPWCGVRFQDVRSTGAPVLLHLGGRDEIAPEALCRSRVREMRAADPAARITVAHYPEARHAFDHPLLGWFGRLPVSGPQPVDCRFREVGPGRFIEQSSGRSASAETLPALFAACGRADLSAGGHPESAARAAARTLAFLRRALDLPAPP
jgi:dienelactone hydrolase